MQFRSFSEERLWWSVHTRTTPSFPGVIIHRNHDLASEHVTRIGDLPVTTLPRTILDLAHILSEKHVRRIVDDLIADRRLTVADLTAIHEHVAKRGRPGSIALRQHPGRARGRSGGQSIQT